MKNPVNGLYRFLVARGPVPLNAFLDLYTGGENRPVFFEIDEVCPELRKLDENYLLIRGELESVLPRRMRIPKYHEVYQDQYRISATVNPDKRWQAFMLYAMGEKPEFNRRHCPRTCEILDGIPHLFQAFFSILEGGKSIPAHAGPYRGYLRYHLGLKIPQNRPPRIRIKDRFYTWEEGKSVLFDDSWEHEVENRSDDLRVVLVVDVMRPLPWLPDRLNACVSTVVRYLYAKRLIKAAGRAVAATEESPPGEALSAHSGRDGA
jgi:aspartyl/asparaginyl beta-hydroxylase (cupin superfamily)